jgi:hypothetical protein
MVRTALLGRPSEPYRRTVAYARSSSEVSLGGSPTGPGARSYRQDISPTALSDVSARRVAPGDGELLRSLMLAATKVPALAVEHRVFKARSCQDWDCLAAERATADRRAIFVLASPEASTGEGLLWCALRRSCPIADLGWWWLHRPVEATPAEQALYDEVARWAAERGVESLVAAADDHREVASLVRAGFVHRGVAPDGHRPVLARPTVSTST